MRDTVKAKLTDEVVSLHYANVLYWRESAKQSREAKAEYQSRQDRLREIRAVPTCSDRFATLPLDIGHTSLTH